MRSRARICGCPLLPPNTTPRGTPHSTLLSPRRNNRTDTVRALSVDCNVIITSGKGPLSDKRPPSTPRSVWKYVRSSAVCSDHIKAVEDTKVNSGPQL
ncbi:hypothetical protein J6590_081722 [Homalodisca vitripennis]|nr:hypothetical protein J6590_081722 [Homalodisca vitripennis]